MKSTYLAVYDYGTGSVWALIDAQSEQQVELLYPELKVANRRPDWMDDKIYSDIQAKFHFDIDNPTGWITNLKRSLR